MQLGDMAALFVADSPRATEDKRRQKARHWIESRAIYGASSLALLAWTPHTRSAGMVRREYPDLGLNSRCCSANRVVNTSSNTDRTRRRKAQFSLTVF